MNKRKNEIKKDLNYYLNLPWEFEFEKAPEGGFYARVKGLSCYTHGDNFQHAGEMVLEALETHLEGMLEEGIKIPEPITEEDCSGKLHVRTSKSMHCKLTKISENEGVSVSHLVNDAIVQVYGKAS